MTTLPVPDLVNRDPEKVWGEIQRDYQQLTGRALHPAQADTLLLNVLAYRESLLRVQIADVARQNLVAFARYPMLDYLGELVGVARLDASPARAGVRFDLTAAQPGPVVIPAGTLVQSADGAVTLATARALLIPAGAVGGSVEASAVAPGAKGNGHAVGSVNVLARPMMHVASASNTEETAGGADTEDDERLRERIRQAPQSFSAAGSAGAYRAHAMTAHRDVVDVAVDSPSPGRVRLSVLAANGVPSSATLLAVEGAVSADTVRPLTDTVIVAAADRIPCTVEAVVTFEPTADPAEAFPLLQAAVARFVADRRSRLGGDVIISQLVAAMSVPGVRRIVLLQPADDVLAGPAAWVDCEQVLLQVDSTGE